MIYLNPVYAAVSSLLFFVVFLYLLYYGPKTVWGDVGQALIFHQVRKYLLRLNAREAHPKLWRPSCMLPIDIRPSSPSDEECAGYDTWRVVDEAVALPLMDFCNNIKKGGLFVLASAVTMDSSSAKGASEGGRYIKLQEE